MRGLLFLICVLIAAVAVPATAVVPLDVRLDTGYIGLGPDGVAVPDTAHAPPIARAGDVRDVLSRGAAELLESMPSIRRVGRGWRGHRASVAVGALPATFTSLSLGGRRATHAISGGLDLISTRVLSPGVLAAESGPDLSAWPVYAASPPSVRADGPGGLPAVELDPGRRPPARPFARVTMGSGDLEWQALGAEFGRRYRQGSVGLGGFLETREGMGPVPGGSYELATAGGRLLIPVSGRWHFEATAFRSDTDRWTPVDEAGSDSLQIRRRVHDFSLVGSDGRSRVEAFHSTAQLDVRGPDGVEGTIATARDGAALRIRWNGTPLDALDVTVASRRARGSLLRETETVGEIESAIGRSFDVAGAWQLSLTGGWSQLGESGFPTAGVEASRPRLWLLSLRAGGRHATPQERLLSRVDLMGESPEGGSVEGSGVLDGERAAVATGQLWLSGRVGRLAVRGEVARIIDPVTLVALDSGEYSPANGDDETTWAASLVAVFGDSAEAGARVTADIVSLDEEGAILSRAPVGTTTVAASAWVSRGLFRDDYLKTRWEVAAVRAAGRSRGPWEGRIDDAATTVSVAATAWAGNARLYVVVEDVVDEQPEYLPGLPGHGRTVTAGFSWDFLD